MNGAELLFDIGRLEANLGVLRLMFITPWMLAGMEILHPAQGGGVAIAGEKD